MTAAEITRYCLCGGALVGRAPPAALAAALVASFELFHTGEGHGPASRAQAAAARRRDENREAAA